MLLTSGQVSVAISSIIVFIFTTTLFLCGYVVQQRTVNDIREAIKPQPRPVHTNLYVPPKAEPTPTLNPPSEDSIQAVEIIQDNQWNDVEEGLSAVDATGEQRMEEDSREKLIQGADGGFLRVKTQRQRKQKALNEQLAVAGLMSEELNSGDISNPRKSSGISGESQPDPRARLSRAARRKLIKDEIVKLAGEEVTNNPNAYKRRRLW